MAEQAGSQSSSLILLSHQQEQPEQPQSIPEHWYKNRLQEFTQKAHIPLPIYHTSNEGQAVPKFRSTVEVDGETYSTLNTSSSRKAAEKDAAKVALEGISRKIRNYVANKTTEAGFPPIHQDKVFCKSILTEFTTRMNIEKSNYETVRVEGLFPVFISSLIVGGVKYTGEPSVSKKEAEQLAARAAILSIMANPELGLCMLEIIKSKAKLYSAVHNRINENGVTDLSLLHSNSGTDLGKCAIKVKYESTSQAGEIKDVMALALAPQPGQEGVVEEANRATSLIGNAVAEVADGTNVQPKHEFRKPVLETCSQAVPLPIAFVPSLQAENPLNASPCAKKRKPKKRKKANKKAKTEIETQVSELPLSQGMSCTVAQ